MAKWENVEFVIPCTMYYNSKKKSFEEKELYLYLCKYSHGTKHLGKCRSLIDLWAAEMPGEESSFEQKEVMDCGVTIHFSVYLKRLDGHAHVPVPQAKESSAKSEPLSVPVNRRAVSPVTVGSSEETLMAESPLQVLDVPSVMSNKEESEIELTASTPPPAPSSIYRGTPDASRSSPTLNALDMGNMKEEPVKKQSIRTPNSARLSAGPLDRSSVSFATAPSPVTTYHNRTPSSGQTITQISRGSESVSDGGNLSRMAHDRKKKILGHRRGKSHAVTPDELKGLTAGDLRTNVPSQSPSQSSSNVSHTRKAKMHLGKAFSHATKRNSTSNLGLSPRGHHQSPSVGNTPTTPTKVTKSLLIENVDLDSTSEDDEDDKAVRVGGVNAWLGSPATGHHRVNSSPRVMQRNMSSPGLHKRADSAFERSPRESNEVPKIFMTSSESGMRKSDDDSARDELELYKQRVSEENRKRDQSFIYHQFVTYTRPAYTSEMSVSSYVIFRCFVEWDSFDPKHPEFREQVLEGFEKLSTSTLDLDQFVYWLSTVVSLLNLLRNNLKPIPRSEVAKNNALAVYQERLRGLVSALVNRVTHLFMQDLRQVLATAVLEQHSLDDAGPSRKSKGSSKATIGEVLKALDALLDHMREAKLAHSIIAQLLCRVSHSMTAHTLNVLLDNNPGLCTFSNGLQMKKPTFELRGWFTRHHFDQAASLLAPLEEVVNVLCMNKSALVESEVRKEVCPTLTEAQLAQLLLLYTPDDFDSSPIHPGVLAQLCGDVAPNAYKMTEELRSVLSLDMTDCHYEMSNSDLPDILVEASQQPSLSFLTKQHEELDMQSSVDW